MIETLPIFIKYILTAIIGMIPIIELRGAIPIGNHFFGLNYIRPLFDFFGKWKPLKKIIDWASEKATEKIETDKKLQTFAALGLYLFVAIPLPGTGAWVGSLIANFLDIPPKKAIPPLALGVLTAGIIVLLADGGVSHLLA